LTQLYISHPKANPIMMLETIDLPLGASSWPIVTAIEVPKENDKAILKDCLAFSSDLVV
jgi:hypothetical protein